LIAATAAALFLHRKKIFVSTKMLMRSGATVVVIKGSNLVPSMPILLGLWKTLCQSLFIVLTLS
jgi:hypothetical protein